ncbi:hypothetical protein BH10ACT1_BH10ACT1_26210 [soil metagenome]
MPSSADTVPTRLALQSVAEHVLSAAHHAALGKIGLRSSPGGFTTPLFPSDHGERQIRVQGTDLVVTDDRGTRREPLTTVAAAAELAEIEPGAPTDVFTPTTALAPDQPLAIDPEAARTLADWWELVDAALEGFRVELADRRPPIVQLWPEHFDIACTIDEVNYGGSPGDAGIPHPYLYVGPWSPPAPDGGYWNQGFGATIAASDVPTIDEAVAFFREGRDRLGAVQVR